MTSEDFYKEVIQSNICPDNFHQIFNDFKFYQNKALDTLREFHRVCELKRVPYQLAYGSLLGAIRDNGQIPWDYDVDVFVPYCEKDKLIKALKENLSDDFYFYCPEVDPRCRHFMMRLAPKGFRSEVLHLDVFYMAGIPEEGIDEFTKVIYKLFRTRYNKLVDIRVESQGRFKTFAKLLLNKIKCIPTSVSKMDKQYEEYCTRYNFYEARNCVGVDDDCMKRYFNTKDMWNTILYETTEGVFRVPQNYDEVLQSIYGDYNKIYPLKGRISQLLNSYNKFEYYKKIKY